VRRNPARLGMIADTLTAVAIYTTVVLLTAVALTDMW
jgi:hypothetical protein